MADDKLDAQGIMEKLRQMLADCEQAFPPGAWYMTISASWRPAWDDHRGSVNFVVTSEPPEDEDDE